MQTEEGLLLLTGDGTIRWANFAASQLLGYSPGELCRMALPLIGSAGEKTAISRGPVAQALHSLLIGSEMEAEGDARIPDKSEKRVAVHWKLWRLPDYSGQQQILLAISETAQASPEGLITSGYRDVFENAVEGIFRTTIEGQVLEVNPALARMFGYRSPAALIHALQDLDRQLYVRPNRRSEFVGLMKTQGFVAGFESEVWRADGTTIWIAVFARTVSDGQGCPLYFEGSVIDISEPKRAEAALKKSEEMFRRLVETSRVVPFEFSLTQRRFTYVGPQAGRLFGHSLGEGFAFESWAAIVHPDDVEAGTRFAVEAAPRATHDFQTEFRIRADDGRIVWVKQIVHCGPVEEPSDHVRGFLFDITEAKLIEEERENSRLQLRQLAARNQQVREEERMTIAREIHDEIGQALTLFKIDLAWLGVRLSKALPDDARQPLEEKISGHGADDPLHARDDAPHPLRVAPAAAG